MKDCKILLISFVLLIFMIGAVSASNIEENNTFEGIPSDSIIIGEESTGIPDNDATTKEIYVNDTGDDSNVGSAESPYATIGKAISNVSSSDKTTIYLSEGTFASDNDSNFIIQLNHKVDGGSLTFIGAGADKTFIDGQSAFGFGTFYTNTNITLKDISFINFKQSIGGVICGYGGILTIENCVFKDSYATNNKGGAIYFTNNNGILTVKNSKFISCYVSGYQSWGWEPQGGGALYVNNIANFYLENNTFIGTSIPANCMGAAVFTNSKSVVNGNKFINLTGTNDGSIFVNTMESSISNNEFINCSTPSTTYSILSIVSGKSELKNNTFINSNNTVGNIYSSSQIPGLNITILDDVISIGNDEINKGVDINTRITDDMGNNVSTTTFKINFINENNTYNYNPSIRQGKYHINFYSMPEVGIYNVTVTSGGITSDALSIADIHYSDEPLDLYVSPEGDDANNGTYELPFATIQHALDVGFEKTFNVIVHLLKGTYSGEGNVELIIANKGSLQLLGEAYGETIIEGNSENWFLSIDTPSVIKNLTFTNGVSYGDALISGDNEVFIEDCIFDNNCPEDAPVISRANINNICFINNNGYIQAGSLINNSYFANNHNLYESGGVLKIGGYSVVENCKFINNTAAENGGVIFAQSGFLSKNNYFEGNQAQNGGVFYSYPWSIYTFENNTFINNKAVNNGVVGVEMEGYESFQFPAFIFNDCKFINNSADKAGVFTLKVGILNNCLFENNSAEYGGAIFVMPYVIESFEPIYLDYDTEETLDSIIMTNVMFENNVAKINGNDIYLGEKDTYYWDEDSQYLYALPLTITFIDSNVTSLVDDLTATVYGPGDSIIGSAYDMTFEFDGKKIGTTKIVNGVATLTYAGFEDGEYVLSGNTYLPSPENIINEATINVKLENITDHIEFWVSPEGSDENGNGSEANPFKSVSYALKEATKNCRDVVIHIGEGNYTGDLNTNLLLSSASNITLIGSGVEKTIFDGENVNAFGRITDGKNKVTITDLTITNMLPKNVEDVLNLPYMSSYDVQTLVESVVSPLIVDEGATLYLNNVNIVNNRGGKSIIENHGDLVVENSIFERNGIVSIGIISGGQTKINNTLFTSNFASDNLLSGDLLLINNSELKDNYNLIGYSFTNGGSSYATTVDVITIMENTKVTNDYDSSALKLIGYDGIYNDLCPSVAINRNATIINITMVNTFDSPLKEYPYWPYTDGRFLAPFGYIYGSGGRYVNVYNSTFKNFQYIWGINTYGHSEFNFDGCVFDNFTMIAHSATPGEGSIYTISNSVFLNTNLEIDRQSRSDREDPNLTCDNNYWGSNDKPVIIYVNPGQATSFEPETWIALYSEDEKSVIKNVTDGENSTEYTGIASIRTDYADNKGALDYAVVFGPIGYLFTTDNETNVIFDPEDEIFPFVAADPMDYRTPTNIAIIGFEGDKNVIAMLVDIVGNPIANATITSTFTGMDAVNTTTDENGTFTVKAGKDGILCIVFAGDDTYFDDEYDLKFVNAGKTAKTFINFIEVDGELVITGTLTDDEGTPISSALVSYVVNGNTTGNATTDANGTFKVQGESNAVIDVAFAGNDIFDAVNATITLKDLAATRMATEIKADDFTQYAIDVKAGEKGGYFKAQLVDASGNPMVNKTVQIGFNGVVYTKITNESGWVQLQINLAKAGEYTFAVVFLGDGDYNASFVVKKITVNKKKTSIDASAKSFKSSVKTKKYTVTLKTDKGSSVDGKTYLRSGKKITLTVGGTTYTAKTNANGQATFKITKLSKKGKFTATVKFDGDDGYLASSKTAKITIK